MQTYEQVYGEKPESDKDEITRLKATITRQNEEIARLTNDNKKLRNSATLKYSSCRQEHFLTFIKPGVC